MTHHCSNIFLCVGRVSEEKGVEDFCKAITELQKCADIRGQVVGVGPLLDTLKQRYPQIEFVGWVNSAQLTKYYQVARALIFPSICNEGSPLTIPEAMSAGLPCIVTCLLYTSIEMTRAIGSNDLRAIGKVRKLIKKYTPDIVYAHSSKAGAIARVADIGMRNCCIYNPHGWAFNMRCSTRKKTMYTAIEKIAAPFCDKIICISDAEKQSALEKKICKVDKLQVIFNGADIEAYEKEVHGSVKRKDLNIPENAFVVGMVGRMSLQKAPDVFVKMARLVKDRIPNAHFIIVGNGEQEYEVRKYAEENGFNDSLHITGWVDNPMSYVELFDVACLLSRWEGFGLVLPEYMMAGKPIVASRVDALSLIHI